MLYLSKIIRNNDKSYIYDAVFNKIVDLPENILKEINSNSLSKNYYDFLSENEIRDVTKPLNFEIGYIYEKEEIEWLAKNRVKSLTLALTEQCNMRCEYCAYMPKYLNPKYKFKNMSRDIAIKAIDIFMKTSKQNPNPSIGFYGGEPLLQFDLIKNCVNHCKEKYPFSKPAFDITTNGLLLSQDRILRFLIENEFSVTVSLDGPKDVHNKFRKDIKGKHSFKEVIKNLTKLYHMSPRYFKNKVSFNSVITPLTGNKEQFDFLENLCSLEIIPIEVMQSDYFSEYLNKVKQSEVTKVEQNFERMNYSFLRAGILKELAQFHRLYTINGQFNLNIFPGGFCVPGSHRLFVNAEGKFIICERVDDMNKHFCIGDVDFGVDMVKLNNLIDITKKSVNKCKSCWAAKLCNICFRDIFSLTDDFCEKKKQEIELGMGYYLNNFKDNDEITSILENFS